MLEIEEPSATSQFQPKEQATVSSEAAATSDALIKAQELFNLGKHSQANEHLDEILRISPNHDQALLLRGWILFIQGNFAAALPLLEFTAKIRPEDHEAALRLGYAQFKLGNLQAAFQIFLSILQVNQSNLDAQINIAYLLTLDGNPAANTFWIA